MTVRAIRPRAIVTSLLLLSILYTEVAAVPPADVPKAASTPRDTPDTKRSFNFRAAPWMDVLEWLAEWSDRSLQIDGVPPGTFNYVDLRPHTPSEAMDVINAVLLTKGYILIRRGRLLSVVNLEDEVASATWRRDNGIRFFTPTAAQLPPIREVTPSRLRAPQHVDQRSRLNKADASRSEPGANALQKPTSEESARGPDWSRRFLRAPSGPVRVVHVEGTDLLLIRTGPGVR